MGRGRPPGPERIGYPLRIDPKILDAVKRVAAAELRSANAQFEVLVKEALTRRGALRKEDPSEIFDD